jgi:ABC-type lipoprotein export system ATPase subunit
MIELIEVTKDYGEPGSATGLAVLKGISLKIEAGRAAVIVGPSGCGKSTLLNLIGGLDHPTQGQVLFDGRDLAQVGDRDLAKIRNRDIGFVFQLHHLLPQCTVLENVLIPTLAGRDGLASKDARARAESLLDRVGLKDHMAHRPGELSGGQRQRVAVARALINKPKLLLADEPTGSLDEATSDGIAELLIRLNREEAVTLVVVTHSSKLATRIGDVMTLHHGVLQDGDPS